MISGLISGWFLSLFGFVTVVKTGMNELFNIAISTTTYYFMFAILGALGNMIIIGRTKRRDN